MTAIRMATFAVPLSGNKGSASMTLGLRDAFAKSGIACQLAVFSYYPERDAQVAAELDDVTVHPGHPKHIAFQLIPLILIRRLLPFLVPSHWKAHLRVLEQADVILAVGGTTFADSMLYKVPWNVLAVIPGYLMGKPTVFLSQTIGPCERWFNRMLAAWTLRRATAVHGRGRVSARWANKVGAKNAVYRPDLSFSMRVPEFSRVAEENRIVGDLRSRLEETQKLPIGVAPNSIVFEKCQKAGIDYIDFIAKIITTVYRNGCLPILIPHSFRKDVNPKKIHNNDRSICDAVMNRLSTDVECFYLEDDLGSGELRSVIGQLHILVASRFHSMISALSQGVPPITYGWGHQKYVEVLEEFGVAELYSPYDEIDGNRFEQRLSETLHRREELAEKIRTALTDIVGDSDAIPQLILQAVGGCDVEAGVQAAASRDAPGSTELQQNLLPVRE